MPCAGRDRDDFRSSVAQSTNEKVQLFRELARLVLDPTVGDAELRSTIYRRIPAEVLQRAVEESDHIIRPLDDSYFDFLASRYSYLRQFAPAFLDAFDFQSNVQPDPLLEAVRLLRRLNAEHRRTIPEDAPLSFVPAKWRTYVIDAQGRDRPPLLRAVCPMGTAGGVSRRQCLAEVQPSLCESGILPDWRECWPTLRLEVCRQMQAPESGLLRLNQRGRAGRAVVRGRLAPSPRRESPHGQRRARGIAPGSGPQARKSPCFSNNTSTSAFLRSN